MEQQNRDFSYDVNFCIAALNTIPLKLQRIPSAKRCLVKYLCHQGEVSSAIHASHLTGSLAHSAHQATSFPILLPTVNPPDVPIILSKQTTCAASRTQDKVTYYQNPGLCSLPAPRLLSPSGEKSFVNSLKSSRI